MNDDDLSLVAADDEPVAVNISDDPAAVANADDPAGESQTTEAPEGPTAVPDKHASRRPSRAEREAYDRLVRRFQACGRCGYLLADCRLLLGEEALYQAAGQSTDGWIILSGDRSFRRLLMDAYGVPLDHDFDTFDGLCPECKRRVVLSTEDARATLRLRA